MKRHLIRVHHTAMIGELIPTRNLLAISKTTTNLTSSLMDNRQWLLDSSSSRNNLLMSKSIFNQDTHHHNYSTSRFVNNNQKDHDEKQNKDKTSYEKVRTQAKYILSFLGLALVLTGGTSYYSQKRQVEHSNVIEQVNLTDGNQCKIYGRINSNKILTLESGGSEEPILIYETTKESALSSFENKKRRKRGGLLRCYNDLEVKFSFGVSDKEGIDSNELTEILTVELDPDCKIFIESKEFSRSIQDFNHHIGKIVEMNMNSKIDHRIVYKWWVDFFNIRTFQGILSRNDQVVLIGKVDPESRVFKCKTLISPNESLVYNHINRELTTISAYTAVCLALGVIVSLY